MDYYAISNGIVAGICIGFGIIFLFTGLRRKDNKRLNLLFAVFALAYAGTLFNGIRFHNATSIDLYVAINRWDSVFVVLAFSALIWYIAEYTQVKPRILLWILTAIFIISGVANILRTNLLYDQILGLNTITKPWGEQVAYLEVTDSFWSLLFLLGQLFVLGYMVYACVRQYLRGERIESLILSIGALWFVAALAAEILGEAGVIPLIFYGEFGFLGFSIAVSLQMSNEVIKTNEELAAYRLNLEDLVYERAAELEATQEKLVQQTKEQATIDERSRLARDLHDAVTQTMYSAALIAEALPAVWERNPEQGRLNLGKLRQLVRGALAEMRTMLFELRPDALEEADLENLLRQLGDGLTGRSRIPVETIIGGKGDIPAEVKITLYRITQEAYNNIAKHSGADEVTGRLLYTPDQVIHSISDNGRGFNPSVSPTDNMGLQIMNERAFGIRAKLDIVSEPGQGTTITVLWSSPDHE